MLRYCTGATSRAPLTLDRDGGAYRLRVICKVHMDRILEISCIEGPAVHKKKQHVSQRQVCKSEEQKVTSLPTSTRSLAIDGALMFKARAASMHEITCRYFRHAALAHTTEHVSPSKTMSKPWSNTCRSFTIARHVLLFSTCNVFTCPSSGRFAASRKDIAASCHSRLRFSCLA